MMLTAKLTTVRKTLGYQKWYWFQGGRQSVTYKRMVAGMDAQAKRELAMLEPLPVVNGLPVECHMYCGHNQIAMGAWAWWSFLRYAREEVTPVMHSDGTLTKEDAALLEHHFPGMVVHDKARSDEIIRTKIPAEKYPHLNGLSNTYVLGARLASFHLDSTAEKIMILDSDILFLERPAELLEYCRRKSPSVVAMKDIKPAYAAPCEEMSRVLGMNVPDLVNGGLCVIPRYTPEMIDWIEKMLDEMPEAWRKNYFLEQTLLAVVAARVGITLLTEKDYRIECDRYSESALCLHYVGGMTIRPRFYTEGIEKLKRQARQSQNT